MSAPVLAAEQRVAAIHARLLSELQASRVEVEDQSERHRGHAGARDGRGHFAVRIEAEVFRGQSLIACHRLVYAALGDWMQSDIHALSIRAEVPARAAVE